MLQAYLDTSSNDAHEVAVVAGVMAHTEQWVEFVPRWRTMLDYYELRRFHATEYWARRGQFQRFNDAQYLAIRADICSLFKTYKLFAIGAIVGGVAFREWRLSHDLHQHPDPHFLAARHCLNQLIRRFSTYPADDGIDICFDRDKEREEMMRDLANWQTDKLRLEQHRHPGHPDPRRAVNISFASSFDVVQLQAADIVAHSAFRWGCDDIRTGQAEDPPFIAGIKPQCPIAMNILTTKELIDLEHALLKRSGF